MIIKKEFKEKNRKYYILECEDCKEDFKRRSDSPNLIKCKKCTNKKSKTSHGMAYTKIYTTWQNVLQRCYNPKKDRYEKYGGRGISVCDEWRYDFIAFNNWAKDNGYSDDLSIDRVNVNGNYEPSNCRWTNRNIQQANRNIQSNNKTGYIGIYRDKGKFVCKIQFKNELLYKFVKDDLDEAVDLRDDYIIANNLPHTLNRRTI